MSAKLMRVIFGRECPGLGQQIRTHRQACGKSLAQLAAEAGISVPHWNRIENEKVQELPVETLRGIEKALGVNLGVEYSSGN